MDKLVIKLKTIEYKKNSFCYLSFWAIYQLELFSHMLLDHTIKPNFPNAILSFFMPLNFFENFV